MQSAMVNPYASASKTAEIMSRYRPIAPKPLDNGSSGSAEVQSGDHSYVDGMMMSEKIQKSAYLRNMWPKLQARPTRTRKRGRTMIGVSVSPTAFKRTSGSATAAFLSPAPHYYAVTNGWFGRGFLASGAVEKIVPSDFKVVAAPVVTLPLLPSSPASSGERNVEKLGVGAGKIDLKSMVEMTAEEEVEKELTLQLRSPDSSSSASGGNNVNINNNSVISPRPIRPVGSCITVTSLTPVVVPNNLKLRAGTISKEAVEAEMEADEVPAIVTDFKNRVRLTNSAYNKMVGQPKCMWLGARIAGEVLINFNTTTSATTPSSGSGFNFKGWVTIEWGPSTSTKDTCNYRQQKRGTAVGASCTVERLSCSVSNDYALAWRFTPV